MGKPYLKNANAEFIAIVCLYAALIGLFCASASLVEDAFITFRTIDNFINGYGLRWNIVERVQSYTHPLWMFVLSTCYWLSGEIVLTAVLASIFASALGIALLVYTIAESKRTGILALLALGTSQAYVDYTTSGLENPLTHLLFAFFVLQYARLRDTPRDEFVLSLIAALALLNRMDTILLYLPALYSVFIIRRDRTRWRFVLLGFTPFAAWEIFSLAYYGFPFPNTAYAKLQTNIPLPELAGRGLGYLADSLTSDPITCGVIASGITLPYLAKRSAPAKISLGVLMYVLYVVAIGGGYMPGRFLTAPFFASLYALVLTFPHIPQRKFALAAAAIVVCNLFSPTSTLRGKFLASRGSFHLAANPLAALVGKRPEPLTDHIWINRGLKLHATSNDPGAYFDIYFLAKTAQGRTITTGRAVGLTGFKAGPQVHIIDVHAINDPLLARTPPYYNPGWIPGHLQRIVPEGYIETHVKGFNSIEDEGLKAYYGHLSTIISDPIFDLKRLHTIIHMNLGFYDDLIDTAQYEHPSKLDILRNEVRIQPHNPAARIALARGLFKIDDRARGNAELDTALQLNQASYNNHIIAGNMRVEFGMAQEASAVFLQAIKIDPDNTDAYVHLAAALLSVDNIPQARSTYEKAWAIDPSNAAIEEMIQKLTEFESRLGHPVDP